MTVDTPAAAPRVVDHDAIMRTFDIDTPGDLWASRETTSKASIIAREAAERLQGMASLMTSIAFAHQVRGGHDTEQSLFLARSARDIARVLHSLHKYIRNEADSQNEAEFAAACRAERKAGRKKGRARA